MRVHEPTTYPEAVAAIQTAKAVGAKIMCPKDCGREATLILLCENGTFQGVGCQPCWEAHRAFIELCCIAEASDMAEPFCSRCGKESPGMNHIVTEEL